MSCISSIKNCQITEDKGLWLVKNFTYFYFSVRYFKRKKLAVRSRRNMQQTIRERTGKYLLSNNNFVTKKVKYFKI